MQGGREKGGKRVRESTYHAVLAVNPKPQTLNARYLLLSDYIAKYMVASLFVIAIIEYLRSTFYVCRPAATPNSKSVVIRGFYHRRVLSTWCRCSSSSRLSNTSALPFTYRPTATPSNGRSMITDEDPLRGLLLYQDLGIDQRQFRPVWTGVAAGQNLPRIQTKYVRFREGMRKPKWSV